MTMNDYGTVGEPSYNSAARLTVAKIERRNALFVAVLVARAIFRGARLRWRWPRVFITDELGDGPSL